jgi:hypothetical protein
MFPGIELDLEKKIPNSQQRRINQDGQFFFQS